MIRIAISQPAFDAMPLGTMGHEPETNAKGERDYLAAAKERQLASLKRGDEQPVRPNLRERGEVTDQLAAMARALL
jgi:hypothetical protein